MIVSLRKRLLWGITLGTTILLTIFSVSVYTITHQTMIQHFDESLLGTARMLSAVIENEGVENGHHDEQRSGRNISEIVFEFEFDVRMTPQFNTLNGGGYFQIWDQEGNVLVRSPSLGKQNLTYIKSGSDAPEYRKTRLPNNKRGRAISYPFLPRPKDELPPNQLQQPRMLTLVLSQNADGIYGHFAFLRWLLAGASLGVVFLSTGVAFCVTRTSLRPIHSLARAITSVGEDNLGLNFPSDHYPAELRPVCQCLNDVFRRLERSFKREKEFNANVAHELRTPLAGIQSTIEVCLSREREPADYRNAFEDCLQIAMAMNKMIDTLLTLSKFDSGQMAIEKTSFHPNELIDNIWRYFSDKAYDKGIRFENSIPPETVCRSDKDRLAMILSNVLENAVEYTDRTGRIRTDVECTEDLLAISVSNTGCRLTQADVEHVFDHFWRKDAARTDAGKHCGIGLPVARKIASLLKITIDVTIDGDVFTVRLCIPNERS